MSRNALRYEKPKLLRHGTIEEVTQSTANGTVTDQDFSADTPIQTILQNLS